MLSVRTMGTTYVANLQANVDGFMEGKYKKAYGDPNLKDDWKLNVPNSKYYPERSDILGQAFEPYSARLFKTPEGRKTLEGQLKPLEPICNREAWINDMREYINIKPGLSQEKRKAYLARLDGYVDKTIATAKLFNVPPALALAVMNQESQGRDDVTSPVGAYGLMQVKDTGEAGVKEWYGEKSVSVNGKEVKISELQKSNPEHNIILGVLNLKKGLTHYDGEERPALAEYNTGEGKFKEAGYQVEKTSEETRTYVDKIGNKLKELEGRTLSPPNILIHMNPEKRSDLLKQLKNQTRF